MPVYRQGMSDLQVIETALQRASRRRRCLRALHGLYAGLLVGATIVLLTLAANKLFPIPKVALPIAGLLAGICLLAGTILGAGRKVSLGETARCVDDSRHLQERLSTALEVAALSAVAEWKALLVADAARHARGLDPRQIFPWRFPRAARWALCVIALGAGLGFVPEFRSKAYVQKRADESVLRDVGTNLLQLTRHSLEQRTPALLPTQKAMESVSELGEKLTQASLTRSEALRDLASAADKLTSETQKLNKDPALKPLEKAAREPGGSGTPSPAEIQKQIDALKQALGNTASDPDKLDKLEKDLQKLQQAAARLADKNAGAGDAERATMSQALAHLAQQAQDLGANLPALAEAIAALQANQTDLLLKDLDAALNDLDKLKNLAQAMQQLQHLSAKLGRNLAEQLENGQAQAAQMTLEKMIQQLRTAPLSPDDLKKMLDEVRQAVDPAGDYGKVADFLKQAVTQIQQGQKPGAAQSLTEAAAELERLMNQMADAQALAATLDALQKAQMCIGNCQAWGECKGLPRAGQGGKPGRGVGTWADESGWTSIPDDPERFDNSGLERPDMEGRGQSDRGEARHNENLMPTKVRGQMSPGGQMPSITLKGVSIKGQSSVPYQEAAAAAQAEAQSALNQDQVPRAYQNAVREYFDDLKK
jgi:ribosomal protein L22